MPNISANYINLVFFFTLLISRKVKKRVEKALFHITFCHILILWKLMYYNSKVATFSDNKSYLFILFK